MNLSLIEMIAQCHLGVWLTITTKAIYETERILWYFKLSADIAERLAYIEPYYDLRLFNKSSRYCTLHVFKVQFLIISGSYEILTQHVPVPGCE